LKALTEMSPAGTGDTRKATRETGPALSVRDSTPASNSAA
jgi:hypothetical protein